MDDTQPKIPANMDKIFKELDKCNPQQAKIAYLNIREHIEKKIRDIAKAKEADINEDYQFLEKHGLKKFEN